MTSAVWLLVVVALLAPAAAVRAEATYTVTTTTSLGSPLDGLQVGETVTVDVTLRSDGELTNAVTASATGYDTGVVGYVSGTAVSSVLSAICLPPCFGGLPNTIATPTESLGNPLGPQVQYVSAVSVGGSMQTGVIDLGVDGFAGGPQFRLVFEALAPGATSITFGALPQYGDVTLVNGGAVGVTNNDVLDLIVGGGDVCGDVTGDGTVDPADASALRDELAGLGAGLAAPENCSVIGFQFDCDVADAAVLLRATDMPPLPPGPTDACRTTGPTPPDLLPDLALWLDAADATTLTVDGAQRVSEWLDKSDAGNRMSAAGIMRPTLEDPGLFGLPVLRFDGVQNVLAGDDAIDLTAGMTLFVVASHDLRKNYQGLFSVRSDPNVHAALEVYWQAGSAGSGNLVYASDRNDPGDGGFFGSNNAGPDPPGAYLATVLVDSDTEFGELRVDSTTLPNVQTAGSGLFTNDVDPPYVGYGFGDTPDTGAQNRLLEGTLAEIVVFRRPLEAAEILAIEAYLIDKWGL